MAKTNHGNTKEEADTDEWLKLSLGTSVSKSFIKSKRVIRSKTYPCAYCTKKFITPQALGGHQNGHKKEREQWSMAKICSPYYGTGRSLPVYSHSSSVKWPNMEYQFLEAKVGVTGGTNPFMLEESASVRWARSFNGLNLRLGYQIPEYTQNFTPLGENDAIKGQEKVINEKVLSTLAFPAKLD